MINFRASLRRLLLLATATAWVSDAQLPPFDESKFEPMPEMELNPKDEFWVDPEKLDLGS